ncbi:MAG: outer membrane beta-barrel protein [Bacteroidetes bacterium]|nr:outer membrane beta-barrel protein [Bacteroidota bacterium]
MKKIYALLFVLFFVPLTFGQLIPKFGLGVNVGMALPQGDMGDLYKTGYGGSLTVILPVPGPFEISASVGYNQFKFNNDYINKLFKEATGTDPKLELDMPLSVVPITANARYYFTPALVRPYAEVNLGVSIATIKATLPDPIPGNPYHVKTSEASETKQYLGVGVGVVLGIGLLTNIDINARYALLGHEFAQQTVSTSGGSTTYTESKSNGSYFGISAGVRVKL